MSRVYVCGLGAVSPAGWTAGTLEACLARGEPLPTQPLDRPAGARPLPARWVPAWPVRPSWAVHPRLRRASPITHYLAASAWEATAGIRGGGCDRLGVIVCLQSGCVQYSWRFYGEILQDPATASPLLFPETVLAAPASHVAALLGKVTRIHTLAGDPSAFLQGMVLGVHWLDAGCVDVCLIAGAEETNWLLADALWHFDRSAVLSGGAGAVCLSRDPALAMGVELKAITDAHPYASAIERRSAVQAMREQLPAGAAGDWLCDGLTGNRRTDAAESLAWRGWPGHRVSLKKLLGEGLMAASAWQCVAACQAAARTPDAVALASLAGANHQALGACFARCEAGDSRLPTGADAGRMTG